MIGVLLVLSYEGGHFIYSESSVQVYNSGISFSILVDNSYDVRDKYNQKVSDLKSEEDLKTLFVSGLYNLLLNSEIYSIAKAIEALYQKFDLSVNYLTRSILVFVQQFFVWFVPQIRKLFSLKVFSFLFYSLILATTFRFISYLFFTPKAKVAPLVLRC